MKKVIVLTIILVAIAGTATWYFFIHSESMASYEEIQQTFNKDFLDEKEHELLNTFVEYLKLNSKDEAIAVILDNKFQYRLIYHKLLQKGLYYRFSNKPDSSEFNLKVALEIARVYQKNINDEFLKNDYDFCNSLFGTDLKRKITIESFYNLGYQNLTNDFLVASKYYQKSLNFSHKIGDTKREVDNLLKLQYFLYNKGSHQEAIQLGLEILDLVREIGYRYRESWTLFGIGTTYCNLNKYSEALECLEPGLKIAKDLEDQQCIASILERICVASRRLGEFSKALNAINESMRITQILDNKKDLVKQFIDIGNIYKNIGDYSKSREYLERACILAHDIKYHNESTALENLGEIYRILGDYENALVYNVCALELNNESQNYYLIARTKKYIGDVYKDQENYQMALKYYGQALNAIEKEAKGSKPQRLESEIWLSVGDVNNEQEIWGSALESYHNAFNSFKNINVPEGIVNSLIRLGNVYREIKQFDQSLVHFNESIKIGEKIQDPLLLWNAFYGIGLVHREKEELILATQAFKKAIHIVEKTREKILIDEEKINYFASIQELYDELILLYHKQAKSDSAFDFSERSRARAFFDLFHGRPEVFIKEYMPLDIDRAINIRNLYSGLPPTIVEIQHALDENITLIEYKLTDEKLIIFVADNKRLKVFDSDISKQELNNLVLEFRKTIGAELCDSFRINLNKDPKQVYDRFIELARELYLLTIEPIMEVISPDKVLYIIPDDALFHLPFAALVSTQQVNDRFFIQDFTIGYAPSASILKYCLDHRKPEIPPNQMNLLAVGNPTGDLTGSEQEVRNIANLFSNTEVLIGDAAREETVLNFLGKDFNIIHFATHAVINEKSPLYSYLALGGEKGWDAKDNIIRSSEKVFENDDLLMVHEIFNVKLPVARLVALSACHSAGGRLFLGEGVVGMSRAFMKAGTSSIIASLWKIDDRYTEKIMTTFYEQWIDNRISKAKALQEAQLKLISELTEDVVIKYPHPYFWAAFALTGDYR